ncbi:MAG: alpha-1,2-fucosyltransferase [Sphingobacteriales bacterium]|jgi:hypothetical protein|nr:alpha-1,2-fucosyltransferase [Sphingobacteriales bacterium]
MIVVRLMGGLGNQLFQYAAGRHLAHLNNADLYLDISKLNLSGEGRPLWKYELGSFNVKCSLADERMLHDFHGTGFSVKERVITQLISFGKNKKYTSNQYGFDTHFLELKGNYYVRGYFLSEKYFKEIADIIRDEITIKQDFKPMDDRLISQIKNSKSIAIHIRRGDYIRNLSSMDAHGLCSKDYYTKAIEWIKSELGEEVHFYLFTDDEAWVRKEMIWDINSTLISNKSTVEDFYLMSLCKHNIIANSTFSWWSAWLNTNPDKIVIIPKHWTTNVKTEEIDLIPKRWIVK